MTNKEWAHSSNGEDYWQIAACREDAITEGAGQARDEEYSVFYIAPAIPAKLEDICVNIDAGDIASWNCDELPEDSEWPEVTKEQDADLEASVTKAVHDWLKRHKLEPDWFSVGKVEELQVEDYPE